MGKGKTWRMPERTAMAQSRGGISRIRLKSNIEFGRETACEIQWIVMDLVIRAVAKIVVPLFFIGMAGSVVVIVVSFIEDLKELLGDED
jgi:hypothetical protein